MELGGETGGAVPREIAGRILEAFQQGHAVGILHLASAELAEDLPAVLSCWRDLGRLFLAHLCAIPDLEEKRRALELPPPAAELAALVAAVPPMRGGEYLSVELLGRYWQDLLAAVQERVAAYKGTSEAFLHTLNPAWNLVGRVCFHLAENKRDPERPFAFLATYTSRLSAKAKPQHLPLGRAVGEFSGAGNKNVT